jgi:hypothetical protein
MAVLVCLCDGRPDRIRGGKCPLHEGAQEGELVHTLAADPNFRGAN